MSRAPSAPPELPGYRFQALLGSGGFADVFLYQEQNPLRDVAVKVLLQGVRPEALEYFRAEANVMAKLSNHPAIVTIHRVGQAADGRPYLVMERCQRDSLDARMKRRPFPVAKALEVGIQVAGAVETAHRLGILHRDIKPANILFTEFGRPALTDFGIASSDGSAAANAFSAAWAPPEQLASQPTDARGDVYSLAATIWAMLGGHSPFHVAGDNGQYAITTRVRTQPVPPLGRRDVPESLERILRTAMAKEPGQRYTSALEFARALQGVQAELRLSVTTIDVIEEREEADESERTTTDTRFTTFIEIDPDAPLDPTDARSVDLSESNATRLTSITGDLGTGTGGSTPAVLSFGYGSLPATGPLDLTGPAVPQLPADATVVSYAGSPPAVTEAPPRRRVGGLVALAVVLVGVAGLALLWSQRGETGASTAAEARTSAPRPVDAVPVQVAKPVDGVATVSGTDVVFTWANPDPQDGDRFLYQPVLLDREVGVSETKEPTTTLPAQRGRTCVDVQVVRAGGRASDPLRICADT